MWRETNVQTRHNFTATQNSRDHLTPLQMRVRRMRLFVFFCFGWTSASHYHAERMSCVCVCTQQIHNPYIAHTDSVWMQSNMRLSFLRVLHLILSTTNPQHRACAQALRHVPRAPEKPEKTNTMTAPPPHVC